MRLAVTNIREVLEAMEEEPESGVMLIAQTCGRALALLETIYLYSPEGRRLIREIIGTDLVVGTKEITAPGDEETYYSKRV